MIYAMNPSPTHQGKSLRERKAASGAGFPISLIQKDLHLFFHTVLFDRKIAMEDKNGRAG